MLQMFVAHFGEFYGKDAQVYNVHSSVHIAQDAKLYGSFNNISAFPFEKYLQKLKKLENQNVPLPRLFVVCLRTVPFLKCPS